MSTSNTPHIRSSSTTGSSSLQQQAFWSSVYCMMYWYTLLDGPWNASAKASFPKHSIAICHTIPPYSRAFQPQGWERNTCTLFMWLLYSSTLAFLTHAIDLCGVIKEIFVWCWNHCCCSGVRYANVWNAAPQLSRKYIACSEVRM